MAILVIEHLFKEKLIAIAQILSEIRGGNTSQHIFFFWGQHYPDTKTKPLEEN